ncbi:hypothetical protein L2E82_20851 [Cichorium intybus]|uniref:Uncharacterized protein n=1 Tax=Cichorium intybus TaxID=13427 RepID=A0ACB9DUX5_CICIN|nr:hypothetical protein L2E82_20851 [Cichorium intybus]
MNFPKQYENEKIKKQNRRNPAVALIVYVYPSVTLNFPPTKAKHNFFDHQHNPSLSTSKSQTSIHPFFVCKHSSYEMAQVSIIVKKVSVLALVALSATATVSAQAMAPAPSPDAGAAFSIPALGVVFGSSMLLSFVAIFRN